MIRFQRLQKQWIRWLKRQRKGAFAQSQALILLTKPLWKHDQARLWVGAPLVASVITGAAMQMPSTDALQSWQVNQPMPQMAGAQVQITTDNSYLLPVAHLTGISQFFHAGHRGLDFRAPLGTDVIAMEAGRVEFREERYGYGRHVYITHESGRQSLYAHLGLVMVETGETVQAGAKIGEIGMTGRTTGPHLHFEIRENNRQVNPMGYLSKAVATYAAGNTQ
jgi:murein DD-endopeptidase MepM/ murein hydrolase activator NlpD